jgi:hypothetical protein
LHAPAWKAALRFAIVSNSAALTWSARPVRGHICWLPRTGVRVQWGMPAEVAGETILHPKGEPMVPKRTLLLAALLVGTVPSCATRGTVDRKRSEVNLRQLVLAMHHMAGMNNEALPANAIFGPDRKPVLSWRVALLPHLDEDALYKEFKLNEPWDSEHNKKLLPRMPSVYAPATGKTLIPHSTFYQVFTGPLTPFDPREIFPGPLNLGPSLRFSFPDGTSNTLLIVEAGEAVPWTKPQDLRYHPHEPLPRLGGLFPEGFHAALANAEVKFISRTIPEKVLRALITATGNEKVDWDDVPLVEQPAK